MNLVKAVLDRLLGRDRETLVTSDRVREQVLERQMRQEARLRSLDLQAETQGGVRRKR